MEEKEIQNLKLKCKGIELEYQYVNQLKDERIQYLQEENKKEKEVSQYYKREFEEAVNKMNQYKQEIEKIKNSRWWKIREKIKIKCK